MRCFFCLVGEEFGFFWGHIIGISVVDLGFASDEDEKVPG